MGYQRHFEYELFTSSMVQIYTNQMKLKSVKTNEKTKKKKNHTQNTVEELTRLKRRNQSAREEHERKIYQERQQ